MTPPNQRLSGYVSGLWGRPSFFCDTQSGCLVRGGVGCWVLLRFFSFFGNFGKNVFIKESEKTAPTLKVQNKGDQWELQATCTLCLPLFLSFSLSLFGALSLGRVDPASAWIRV